MPDQANPFNELYVTETIAPDSFVHIFSPLLLPIAMPMFQTGNVIIKGVRGSGKSMLLNLLKPEIRLAYLSAKRPFPVPADSSRFIGCGINLTRSGAIDIGYRLIDRDRGYDRGLLPLVFGDFLNFWIVQDLLNSLETLATEASGAVRFDLGIQWTDSVLSRFSELIVASDTTWRGALGGCDSYAAIRSRIDARIRAYRDYTNYNIRELPNELIRSKTNIGEPIAQTVQAMWESGLLPESTAVFVRLDQYEELYHLEDWTASDSTRPTLTSDFRAVVNKLLSTRDRRISYRIGGRRYALSELKVLGTTSVLEEGRNFQLVDLDESLRRREHRSSWIFPSFAEDVFKLRMQRSFPEAEHLKLLPAVFGKSLDPRQEADFYVRAKGTPVVGSKEVLPSALLRLLSALERRDPLSAKLGEAWSLQQLKRPAPQLPQKLADVADLWENTTRKWWRKERLPIAMLQIAASRRQRLVYSGSDSLISLAGGNILVFVSLCQAIWANLLRFKRGDDLFTVEGESFPLDTYVQTQGVEEASLYWHGRIESDPGGNSRRRFIDFAGRFFREKLIADSAMSYPGHNGFSLAEAELRSDPELARFLQNAVDFGALFDRPHTPKHRGAAKRIKYYLNPILSPFYQITLAHTKEPLYLTLSQLRTWLSSESVRAVEPTPNDLLDAPLLPMDQQLKLF